MAITASVPGSIGADPAAYNLNPADVMKLEMMSLPGGIDFSSTPATSVAPGIDAYIEGNKSVLTSENTFYNMPNQHEDIILLNNAGGASGNWRDNGMLGNENANTLFGEGGDDLLIGSGGNDILDGGNGDDYLDGGDGNDLLDGGNDNDTIIAGSGNDTVKAGTGDDYIEGGSGADLLRASKGNDTVDGGTWGDEIYGYGGKDYLMGGGGRDYIDGGWGADTIEGGFGNDTIFGAEGGDTLIGGRGDDLIDAGTGGTVAKDTFVWADGDGEDLVLNLGSSDMLDLTGASDYQLLDAGADTILRDNNTGDETRLVGVKREDISDDDNDDIWTIS